jgi:hypothetical protein
MGHHLLKIKRQRQHHLRKVVISAKTSSPQILIATDWEDDGFACRYTTGISNFSLSLSHEYHQADSLQLTDGKDGSKQHF